MSVVLFLYVYSLGSPSSATIQTPRKVCGPRRKQPRYAKGPRNFLEVCIHLSIGEESRRDEGAQNVKRLPPSLVSSISKAFHVEASTTKKRNGWRGHDFVKSIPARRFGSHPQNSPSSSYPPLTWYQIVVCPFIVLQCLYPIC